MVRARTAGSRPSLADRTRTALAESGAAPATDALPWLGALSAVAAAPLAAGGMWLLGLRGATAALCGVVCLGLPIILMSPAFGVWVDPVPLGDLSWRRAISAVAPFVSAGSIVGALAGWTIIVVKQRHDDR